MFYKNENLQIYLRNDSDETINIGNVSILQNESVKIWDTTIFENVSDTLQQIVENENIFNQNIGSNDIVMVVNGVDQSSNQAWSKFHEIRCINFNELEIDGYNIGCSYIPSNYEISNHTIGNHISAIDKILEAPGSTAVFCVWAEENDWLSDNTYEWSFGANGPSEVTSGLVIPINCECFAMSLNMTGTGKSARVRLNVNGSSSGLSVTGTSTTNAYTTFETPVKINAGDLIGFYTEVGAGSGDSNRVTAWFRSSVKDLIDENKIIIRRNSGSNVGSRPRVNFIEGNNVSITVTDDPTDQEIDVTISSTGGGGGGGGGLSLWNIPQSMINKTDIDVYSNDGTWGGLITPCVDVSVTALQCWVYQSGGGNVQGAIYNAITNAIIDVTAAESCSTTGIKKMTFSTPISLTKAASYYLAIGCTANGSRFAGRDDWTFTFNLSPKPLFRQLNSRLPSTLNPSAHYITPWIQALL
jgi:hypothetical protein